MKIFSVKKGDSMSKDELNFYDVGVMRLGEMAIAIWNFSESDIIHIGYCSIHHIKVVLCKVGNSWGIQGRMEDMIQHFERKRGYRPQVRAYWIVAGKKVKSLRPHYKGTTQQLMKAYESRDRSKSISEMSAMEIFIAAKEKRPGRRRAPRMSVKERIGSSTRMEKL